MKKKPVMHIFWFWKVKHLKIRYYVRDLSFISQKYPIKACNVKQLLSVQCSTLWFTFSGPEPTTTDSAVAALCLLYYSIFHFTHCLLTVGNECFALTFPSLLSHPPHTLPLTIPPAQLLCGIWLDLCSVFIVLWLC